MGTAFLITTTSCTRECPYCFYVTGVQERTSCEMGEEELVRCVRALARRGYGHLILTGGEPLLRPDLPGAVGAATSEGVRTLLITNGELLDGGLCRTLVKSGLGGVAVSVDSMEEGMFKSSLDAAARAREAGIPVSLITVVTRQNAGEVDKLRKWASRKEIGVVFQPVHVPPEHERYGDLSLHGLESGAWESLKASLEVWARDCGAEGYIDLLCSIYEGTGRRPQHCGMGTDAMVIDCDGSVYPCFHRRDLFCGNLLREGEMDVFKRLREAGRMTAAAPCYGEHCLSLFFGQV